MAQGSGPLPQRHRKWTPEHADQREDGQGCQAVMRQRRWPSTSEAPVRVRGTRATPALSHAPPTAEPLEPQRPPGAPHPRQMGIGPTQWSLSHVNKTGA